MSWFCIQLYQKHCNNMAQWLHYLLKRKQGRKRNIAMTTSVLVTDTAAMGIRRVRNKHLIDSQDGLSLNTLLWERKRPCAVQNSEDSHFRFSFLFVCLVCIFFSFGKGKEQWLYVALLDVIIGAQNWVINYKGNLYHTLAEYTKLWKVFSVSTILFLLAK